MTHFDFSAFMQSWQTPIHEALLKATGGVVVDPKNRLLTGMRYSLLASGKRLRPLLCVSSALALGLNPVHVLPVGVALEMIHVFSLVHDDLPSMDNDDLRRGQPTLHKVQGEALAILCGDALLSDAFRVMAEDLKDLFLSDKILHTLLQISKAAGPEGLILGQVLDLEGENKALSLNELKKIHLLKTGALLKASVLAPVWLSGINDERWRALETYAEAMGLAFQISDDILDVEGVDLGKTAGKDEKSLKATYPRLLGLSASKQALQDELSKAQNALSIFKEEGEPLRALARLIVNRKN